MITIWSYYIETPSQVLWTVCSKSGIVVQNCTSPAHSFARMIRFMTDSVYLYIIIIFTSSVERLSLTYIVGEMESNTRARTLARSARAAVSLTAAGAAFYYGHVSASLSADVVPEMNIAHARQPPPSALI